MNRKHLLLVLWIAAAVFPFGWLTVYSRDYSRAFNAVFEAEIAHLAAHFAIFFGLAYLLAIASGARALRGWRVFVLWSLVCAVALAQESVQLWYKRRAWGSAETFDLATDLIAGAAGLLLALAALHFRSRRRAVL